jgi:hypothetical protein
MISLCGLLQPPCASHGKSGQHLWQPTADERIATDHLGLFCSLDTGACVSADGTANWRSKQVQPHAVQQVLVLCLCRNKSVIVIAGVANTLPVMLWLMYIIHVTLRENEEDAQNVPKPVRISEFLKVNAMYHRQFPVAVCFTLQDYVVSSYINLV